ncbi:hypothetical protein BGW38_010886 [Lunasporangiospora selenospora]|uniref:Cytochrome P450 n=1 Tax=Lunasporangiospora selenospora TaxID=979761 RepID=A0A9P6FWG0_9FUNG|nr:hypothetical protein BGW38_010886 [Lunasporangiospora selenospora]
MPVHTLIDKATQQSTASLVVTLSAIFTYGFYKTWLYPFYLDPLSRIQGPKPSAIPFLGNMLGLIKKKPMLTLYDWAMQYPSIFRYYWFTRLTLLTSDPVTVGYVLGKGNDNWIKSKETEDIYLKSMTSAFHGVALELVEAWVDRLDPTKKSQATDKTTDESWEQDGKVYTMFDLEPSFYCMTLDSIGQFALGRGFDAIKQPIGPEFENYKTIVDSFKVTLWTMLPFSNWIPTQTNRRAWAAIREFNASMSNLVQERKQTLIKEVLDNNGDFSQDESASSQKKDMLTMLLVDQLAGQGGSDLQIRQDVFTAIFAGHETTSASLSWTFYQLAIHPQVQDRLREEVNELFEKTKDKLSYDDFNGLPYLSAVVRESLRIWSPVPLNLRVSVEDDHLPRSNGLEPLFVPKGTNLHIPMFILQRDPRIWGEDALEFNPDRWLDEKKPCPPVAPPNGLCYLPFYHGKRSCIGNKIATLEMKIHIANLIHRFEFVQTPEMKANAGDIDWRWSVSLKPSPGIKLGVRPLK